MRQFIIAGCIVDTDADRTTYEDVTPAQVNSFLSELQDGEEAEFEITSFGGSVTAGLAIANLIKQSSANGHKITAHVVGIAASMASAITCACDVVKIDANAFMMIHLPWCNTAGNALDLRKDADMLDKYRDAMVAIYRTKFDMTDDQVVAMMEAETWIIGEQSYAFKFNAEVILNEEPLRAAACLKSMPKYNNTPKALADLVEKMETEEKIEEKPEEVKAEQEVTEEAKPEEAKPEEPKSEETAEDFTPEVVETVAEEKMVTQAEVEKRVSGMQSTMAKKIDALKKEYDAKIEDFNIQLKAKDEELENAKAEAISLAKRLENSDKELSRLTSALEEKETALATLNAGVNKPLQATNWKSLKGQAFLDWVHSHPEEVKQLNKIN